MKQAGPFRYTSDRQDSARGSRRGNAAGPFAARKRRHERGTNVSTVESMPEGSGEDEADAVRMINGGRNQVQRVPDLQLEQ